jgi:hypothetical protein
MRSSPKWGRKYYDLCEVIGHAAHRHYHLHPRDKSDPNAAATTLKAGGGDSLLFFETA